MRQSDTLTTITGSVVEQATLAWLERPRLERRSRP